MSCVINRTLFIVLFLVLAAVLSLILIVWESFIMSDLCACYLSNLYCCAFVSLYDISSLFTNTISICQSLLSSSSTNISAVICRSEPTDKLSYIKGQMASAAGTLAMSVIHIVIFCCICSERKRQRRSIRPASGRNEQSKSDNNNQ